jgi:membrane-bound lytic murein transglycosylase B
LKLDLNKIITIVVLSVIFCSYSQELRNIVLPRQKYLYEYREIHLSRMRDSLNSDLYGLQVDRNNIQKLTGDIYFKTLRYNVFKYRLYNVIDTLSMLDFTNKDLNASAYFKSRIPAWSDSALVEYITFRIELNLIKKHFSEFNLNEFKTTEAYQNLKKKIQTDSLLIDEFDILLEKIQTIGFDPLHFYYKPKSKEEQLKADEFDVMKFDFDEMKEFMNTHNASLDSAEARYKVNKEIIVAILRKETHLGRVELKYNPFEVLLGQAMYSITNPATEITERTNNLKRISRLQNSAVNSLYHIIKYCLVNKIEPQDLKSNVVGALGYPQFMPFNLYLARDGNNDGKIDLSDIDDSIMSIGNFLQVNGWNKFHALKESNKSKIIKLILKYNSNDAYADAVYKIAFELKKRSGSGMIKGSELTK